jgi:predicted lipoprotein with Yx(FWY)xxD motif
MTGETMNIASIRSGLLAGSIALGLLAGCASYEMKSAAAPARIEGGALVGTSGMTLYTFDKDAAGSGKSACNGPCAANWPPHFASDSDSASGNWSIITRDDGKKQWAFKGKPLYFWIKDQKPGDKTGDGVNNAWRTAKE